jgi:hypothetical protein
MRGSAKFDFQHFLGLGQTPEPVVNAATQDSYDFSAAFNDFYLAACEGVNFVFAQELGNFLFFVEAQRITIIAWAPVAQNQGKSKQVCV